MKCPNCLIDFEPEHKLQKYCTRRCKKKFNWRKQAKERVDPFKLMRVAQFEPTDIDSFYHREDERRKTRRSLRER